LTLPGDATCRSITPPPGKGSTSGLRGRKAALLGALAYFVLPIDLIPDILPVLGYADDAAVLATALRLVASHIRPEHREAARQALSGGLEQ
jgi:uncharacterized membrane protein YkvA (DUF1232 family)